MRVRSDTWRTLKNGLRKIKLLSKIEKFLKGSLDLIPSVSPSVTIQIFGGKICFDYQGKTLLGVVNKLLITKRLLTSPSNVFPYYLKSTILPIIIIFTEEEGDEIESKLLFKNFLLWFDDASEDAYLGSPLRGCLILLDLFNKWVARGVTFDPPDFNQTLGQQ